MDLEWMQKHRALVGKMIRFANAYTVMYTRPVQMGTDIEISASQIQTLEYVMENETMKMSDIAQKLGVTKATFSHNAQHLVEMGLLSRYRRGDNKKEVYLFATDLGKKVYKDYTDYVFDNWYRKMFEMADGIPEEYLQKFGEIVDWYTYTLIHAGRVEDKIVGYQPIDPEQDKKACNLPENMI